MPRSSDRDRIIWLLQEQGRCSNRYVRTTLSLSDDRYSKLRQELLESGLAEKVKGQGGGIQLTKQGLKADSLPEASSAVQNEKALYTPFVGVLESESTENEEPAIVIDTSALRKSGKWSNPDITKVSVRNFPILRTHKIIVTTYELKQWGRWNIEAVFEAASQRRFAHESYVVLEWAKDEEVAGLDEMLSVCSRFGVGLLTLHPYYKGFRYVEHLEAEKHSPSEEYLEEFLGYIFEKNPHAKERFDSLCAQEGV